jgi:hypothetical protein
MRVVRQRPRGDISRFDSGSRRIAPPHSRPLEFVGYFAIAYRTIDRIQAFGFSMSPRQFSGGNGKHLREGMLVS